MKTYAILILNVIALTLAVPGYIVEIYYEPWREAAALPALFSMLCFITAHLVLPLFSPRNSSNNIQKWLGWSSYGFSIGALVALIGGEIIVGYNFDVFEILFYSAIAFTSLALMARSTTAMLNKNTILFWVSSTAFMHVPIFLAHPHSTAFMNVTAFLANLHSSFVPMFNALFILIVALIACMAWRSLIMYKARRQHVGNQ